jgi:hypothetical protein
MNKQTAIKILGGTPVKAAKALGYKTVQAIYVWPETLPMSISDRVNGAALRLKLIGKRNPKQPEAANAQ